MPVDPEIMQRLRKARAIAEAEMDTPETQELIERVREEASAALQAVMAVVDEDRINREVDAVHAHFNERRLNNAELMAVLSALAASALVPTEKVIAETEIDDPGLHVAVMSKVFETMCRTQIAYACAEMQREREKNAA